MTRIRSIKPGLMKNPDLARCSLAARYLFPGLWMLADREGRLEDNPPLIKAELLPYDDADTDALLEELAQPRMPHTPHGFITRYTVAGVPYIQVNEFTKHQRPHAKEQPSTIPAPPQHRPDPNGSLPRSVEATTQEVTSHNLGALIREGNGIQEGNSNGGGKGVAPSAKPPPPIESSELHEILTVLEIGEMDAYAVKGVWDTMRRCAAVPEPISKATQAMAKNGHNLNRPGDRANYFGKWMDNCLLDLDKNGRDHLKIVQPQDIPSYSTGFPFVDELWGTLARLNLQRQLPARQACNWSFEQLNVHDFDGQIVSVSAPPEGNFSDFEDWPVTIRAAAKEQLNRPIRVRFVEDYRAAG